METVSLKQIEWPDFGVAEPLLPPSLLELENRLERCRMYMRKRQISHLVVYGDREHFANLMYLTHVDPRFEESLLIISDHEVPLILVGNECVGHLSISPLFNAGRLRYERYQPFSLLDQPRDDSRALSEILRDEGFRTGTDVGCAGWKYFTAEEFESPGYKLDIPSYIADTLRSLCGNSQVTNATDLFMSPDYGLRTTCSVYEIACFERSNIMASEGMKHLLMNFKADVSDYEIVRLYQYTGHPLNCHIGMKSSGNQHYGLSSPTGDPIRLGDPCSTNIGYWGSNICRAGWVARDENDLPESAQGYVEQFAAPYFLACAKWYEHLRIGTKGHDLWQLIQDQLPFSQFGVFLNPGHLIHLDEWVSSPIYQGSEVRIRSGMYLQVDIIPRSARYFSSRMEEGIIIADSELRERLRETYPDIYHRCMKRRQFMTDVLGFVLPDELLPLSNIPGLVPPFFLNYRIVLTRVSSNQRVILTK